MKFSATRLLLTLAVILTLGSLAASAGERVGLFSRVRERVVHRERVIVRGGGMLLPRLATRGAGCHGTTAVGAGCYGTRASATTTGTGCYGSVPLRVVPPAAIPMNMPPRK